MGFHLSQRSRERMFGVHEDLVAVVQRAIRITEVDFSVIEGLRTIERQRKLFRAGASQTMNSRHLTGHAVDLAAWVEGEVRWDWPLYFKIARAVKQAATELNTEMVWGGIWDKTLNQLDDNLEQEQLDYIHRFRKKLKKAGKKVRSPFIDGPHFQLSFTDYSA